MALFSNKMVDDFPALKIVPDTAYVTSCTVGVDNCSYTADVSFMWPYYTTTTGGNWTEHWNTDNTWSTWSTGTYVPNSELGKELNMPEEEDEVATDVCRFCKAELVKRSTFEYRVAKKKKDEDDEQSYIWKEQTVSEYECGTIIRDGDIEKGTKRVTVGAECVEFAE